MPLSDVGPPRYKYVRDLTPDIVDSVKGAPDKSKTIQECAFAAYTNLPPGMEPGMEATNYYDPPNLTFPFGTYICVVDIDRGTGEVSVRKFVAVDDCGNIINPMGVGGLGEQRGEDGLADSGQGGEDRHVALPAGLSRAVIPGVQGLKQALDFPFGLHELTLDEAEALGGAADVSHRGPRSFRARRGSPAHG